MMTAKLFKTALTALRINVLRSFLTMLGIIIGVSAVIIMVALGAGAQREVDAQIEALGGNIFMLMGSFRRMGGAATAAGSVQSLSAEHATLLEEQLPSVAAVAPEINANAQAVFGNLNWSTQVIGSDNRYLVTRNWTLAAGREFTAQEIASGGKVAIIGDTVRAELFGEGDPIGESIRLNKVNATVIGLLEAKGQDLGGQDQDDVVLMPIRTVRNRLTGLNAANPNAVQRLIVKVHDGEDLAFAQEDIVSVMNNAMRVSANDEEPFMLRNFSEMVATRAATQAIFNSLLAGVASVSLLVGGIGIMNIMLVSVTERTRELLAEALTSFFKLREVPGLKKKPSTSELLDWIKLLVAEDIAPEVLRADQRKALPPLYGALLKNEQDVHLVEQLLFLSRREAR